MEKHDTLKSQVQMDEELGTLYDALWQEVALLWDRWNQYIELYGTSPERIKIMNKGAPKFFHYVQEAFLRETILHISRLTDPSESFKNSSKANLTICALPTLIKDEATSLEVYSLVKKAKDDAEFCRDWRNRRLAHRDLKLALKITSVVPLKPASRQGVRAALNAIGDVLNAVSKHYLNLTTNFDMGSTDQDGLPLLCLIDDGLTAKEEWLERMRSGNETEQDIKKKEKKNLTPQLAQAGSGFNPSWERLGLCFLAVSNRASIPD